MGADFQKKPVTMTITGTVNGVGTTLYNPLGSFGFYLRSKIGHIMGKKIYFKNVVLVTINDRYTIPVITIGILKEADYADLKEGDLVEAEVCLESTFKNNSLQVNVKAVSFRKLSTPE